MPNRMIRGDLLDSERYWNCSAEARCLYISILLCADDTARCQGSEYFLRTRCLANTVPASRIPKLVSELVDEDLIRLYQCGTAQYIFVPRFKQRLRYVNSRHPAPPNEINDMIEKKTVSSQTQDGLKSARSEVEVSLKRREVEVTAKPVFKEFPKGQTSNHEDIERNRSIASALANGNVGEAARLRGKA